MERPAKETTKELLVEHSLRLAEFEPAFREENRLLFQERTRFLLKASLIFYPAFWFLDLAPGPPESKTVQARCRRGRTAGSL